MWTAFPSSDYYGGSVAVGLAPVGIPVFHLSGTYYPHLGTPFVPLFTPVACSPVNEVCIRLLAYPNAIHSLGARHISEGTSRQSSLELEFEQYSSCHMQRVLRRGMRCASASLCRFTGMLLSAIPFGPTLSS